MFHQIGISTANTKKSTIAATAIVERKEQWCFALDVQPLFYINWGGSGFVGNEARWWTIWFFNLYTNHNMVEGHPVYVSEHKKMTRRSISFLDFSGQPKINVRLKICTPPHHVFFQRSCCQYELICKKKKVHPLSFGHWSPATSRNDCELMPNTIPMAQPQ